MADRVVAERAVAAGFALGWQAGWALGTAPARAGFDVAADVGWRRGGPAACQLQTNLRRVVGPEMGDAELHALTRRGLRSYARYFREIFWLPRAGPGVVAARTRISGAEHVDAVRRAGRGVICALPHTGNWDAAAVAFLERFGPPMTVVAERLHPETLYRRFQSYRESLGMQVVPLTGGERPSAGVLAERLRSGGSVCLVCDRDLSSSGVPVTFFGHTITVPPGPALLAYQTGAALVPTLPGFDGDDWSLTFFPEIPVDGSDAPKRLRDKVTQAMQTLVERFETLIAAAPQDWHMVQPLWQQDLASARTGWSSR